MEYIIIGFSSLFASLLTFFSGFGLGTIMLPVFALFFPIELAVAITGVVHFLNNLFKITLVGKHASWKIIIKFGIPAVLMAFLGAWLLTAFTNKPPLFVYYLGDKKCSITLINLIISILMFVFALLELLPFYKKLSFSEDKLYIGGAISGFFGGLSGHQGALRSAFLIKCGLTKEAYIATGIVIATIVDISRLSVYFSRIDKIAFINNQSIIFTAVISAFTGAYFGKKLLKKITLSTLHIIVSLMIMVLSILLGMGYI
jgi:hypothetical protein